MFFFCKFHVSRLLAALSRFMEAYKQGATGDTVLAKTKEMKRYHRVPLRIDPQPRVGYDRNRGRQALENIRGNDNDHEGTDRSDQVIFTFQSMLDEWSGVTHVTFHDDSEWRAYWRGERGGKEREEGGETQSAALRSSEVNNDNGGDAGGDDNVDHRPDDMGAGEGLGEAEDG